jgi:hypothetical protein
MQGSACAFTSAATVGMRRPVLAHFEAGSHEIRKSLSWVHGFLLHLFPN